MDQRLDENASTLAAIGHIKELSKLYKSDNWTLLSFITSPNYVSNIIRKIKTNKWEEAAISYSCVNKMDLVDYNEKAFSRIKEELIKHIFFTKYFGFFSMGIAP